MIEHEVGNWESFRANLSGLQSVVVLHGGIDALEEKCPRARILLHWAEHCLTQHETQGHLEPKAALICFGEEGTDFWQRSNANDSVAIPTKLLGLRARDLISETTLMLIRRTVHWFKNHISTENDSKEQFYASGRDELARSLHERLQDPDTKHHDVLVDTALFLLVVSHPPSFILKGHPDLIRCQLEAILKIPNRGTDQSCLLWIGLIVASLPLTYSVPASARLKMLQEYILRAPVGMTWEQARKLIARFWLPSNLDDIRPGCWHMASMQTKSSR